jgi:hypothetical protein
VNVRRVENFGIAWTNSASGADLLLAAGGDERIVVDGATGRNRYGTTVTPRPEEIFLSSSTASTITPRAHRAVEKEWAALSADPSSDYQGIDVWLESLRTRLLDLLGIAGCQAILTGSGTEAELTALAIAKSVLGRRPLTNIVLAPAETGSGVLRAAAGTHFLDSTPFGETGLAGHPLTGWAGGDIQATTIEIRDSLGDPRLAADIDAEARHCANAAIQAGRNVLLHLLQTSKTGCAALSAATASQILAAAPDRIMVVADCCQLRSSPARVQQLLRLGFMVAVTGSKFFGGPPFSGALIVPSGILSRIAELKLPVGFAAYSSRQDWPRSLRENIRLRWINEANLGLGLRWVAALTEMERFFATPDDSRARILAFFAREVRSRAQCLERLHEISGNPDALREGPASILSFAMAHDDGAPFSATETAAVHARLRSPCEGSSAGHPSLRRIFHVGQPVAIGRRTVLRICASAPMVSDIAECIARGETLAAAFAHWERNLDALFEKWRWLMRRASGRRSASMSGSRELGRQL